MKSGNYDLGVPLVLMKDQYNRRAIRCNLFIFKEKIRRISTAIPNAKVNIQKFRLLYIHKTYPNVSAPLKSIRTQSLKGFNYKLTSEENDVAAKSSLSNQYLEVTIS